MFLGLYWENFLLLLVLYAQLASILMVSSAVETLLIIAFALWFLMFNFATLPTSGIPGAVVPAVPILLTFSTNQWPLLIFKYLAPHLFSWSVYVVGQLAPKAQ